MSNLKLTFSLMLCLALAVAGVGAVGAAAPTQEGTSILGTVQGAVLETDSGTATVLVTLLVNGETRTVRITFEAATSLGLVTTDEAGNPVVDESMYGSDVEIKPGAIIPDEGPQHPVGARIAAFFSSLFNVDYGLVMGTHTRGFGFGVITQALWMTEKLGGDASMFETILAAKESGDYSLVALPDGFMPQSWGQLKKAVLKGEEGNSLGDIMGNGNDTSHGNGNGKPDEPGNGNPAVNPGNGNGKPDDGTGKPANPPGQDKNKDKDKDKSKDKPKDPKPDKGKPR